MLVRKTALLKFISNPTGSRSTRNIGQRLRSMHLMEALDALDLDEDSVRHDKIGAMFADDVTLVEHGDSHLSRERRLRVRQLDAKRLLIGRLKKSRPEMADAPRSRNR
jgi:DNA-directed RNA polymerase sigma subunit (sigma70/sigma32)